MKRATTVVVTTSDPAPMREAVRFFHALPEVASRPAAVFFNRSLPETWIDARPPRGTEAALAANLARWGVEAQKQRSARRELGERTGWRSSRCPSGVPDLTGRSDRIADGSRRGDQRRAAR